MNTRSLGTNNPEQSNEGKIGCMPLILSFVALAVLALATVASRFSGKEVNKNHLLRKQSTGCLSLMLSWVAMISVTLVPILVVLGLSENSRVEWLRPIWPAAAISAFALSVVAGMILWWLRHSRELLGLEGKDKLSLHNELVRTVAQILGGTVLLVGAYMTWRNVLIAQEGQITDRFNKAVEQLGSTLESNGNASAGASTGIPANPSASTAPLPNPNALPTPDRVSSARHIGAIFALERIAQDSTRDRQAVSELLAAYLREHAAWNSYHVSREKDLREWITEAEQAMETAGDPSWNAQVRRHHIQAAVTVLARRTKATSLPQLNLSGTDLRGMVFNDFGSHADFRGTDFRNSCLVLAKFPDALLGPRPGEEKAEDDDKVNFESRFGRSWLAGADFERADLTHAQLDDAVLADANLTGATFQGANFQRADLERATTVYADFRGANLQYADLHRANLRGARLDGADLRDSNLEDVTLDFANLTGAQFDRADLKRAILVNGAAFHEAVFRSAQLDDAVLADGNFEHADFGAASLRGARFYHADLQEANLSGATLNEAALPDANLQDADLEDAILTSADLHGANLQRSKLDRATLESTDLLTANLREASLRRAILKGANLESADLQNADLGGANLQQANLQGADLRGANLQGADLRGANVKDARLDNR
jgi:uncharacterized protein YjbI with pentapeptide repeats